jgi:integrase
MQSYRPPAGLVVDPAIRLSIAGIAEPTFREQGEAMMVQLAARKRKPVHDSTLFTWRHYLNHWIYPSIGDLPLSEIKHSTIKPLIRAMSDAGLKPTTIDVHFRLISRVLASYIDEQGESIYARKWNFDFLDLPVIGTRTLNRPCFSEGIVSGLARWRFPREQMIFILAAVSGARIGELLGLDIGQHVSTDCSTLRIERGVNGGHLVPYVKTIASYREIDLHDTVARVLKQYIGGRTSGLLFSTANGTPMRSNNILAGHLHPALRDLEFVNVCTGTARAGMHAFRRFRNTLLGKCPGLPERLQKYWMGHSASSIAEKYDRAIEDREFRKSWTQRCGIGFKLPCE